MTSLINSQAYSLEVVSQSLDQTLDFSEDDPRFVPSCENIDFVIRSTATQINFHSSSERLANNEDRSKVTFCKCPKRKAVLKGFAILFQKHNKVYEELCSLCGADVVKYYDQSSEGEFLKHGS